MFEEGRKSIRVTDAYLRYAPNIVGSDSYCFTTKNYSFLVAHWV